jgi:hypothetical protein
MFGCQECCRHLEFSEAEKAAAAERCSDIRAGSKRYGNIFC